MLNDILEIVKDYYPLFLEGVRVTLTLALLGTIIGLFLGLGIAMVRTLNVKDEKNKTIRIIKILSIQLSKIYVTIFRGTPMMVQAVIIYYGIKSMGAGNWWTVMIAGVVIVSLNTTAYLSEVFRGGIQSLDKGQVEGARSLGFNQFQTFIYIVLPQTLKNTFPSVGNEFIVNIKDTSVLRVIGIADLFYYSYTQVGGATFKVIECMIIAAISYLFLTYTVSKILMLIEKKWDMPVKEITSSN